MSSATAYRPPKPQAPIDLKLDSNEGAAPPDHLLSELVAAGSGVLQRYPDRTGLESKIADELGIAPARCIVTAGGDDALDRICRVMLEPGRELILPAPTFEMIERYAGLTGATIVSADWLDRDFPIDEVLDAVTPRTAIIAVVSPNNPTGRVVSESQLVRLSEAAPDALIVVDLAYVEFADIDPTPGVLRLPNAVAVRTFSKAWGLAGLRVGYAVGSERVIGWLRAAGGPYSVAGPSLAVAGTWIDEGRAHVERFVARVRREREALNDKLRSLGAEPAPSQANFSFARMKSAKWVHDALAGLGIAVRYFHDRPELAEFLRITCPGDEKAFDRLLAALDLVHQPEAILFDMDGVLADVSGSYRRAIVETAATFGVSIDHQRVERAKAGGGANDDWALTHRLVAEAGVSTTLDRVIERFESAYQGTHDRPGLRATERLIPSLEMLERMAARFKLAVVTGRPKADCDHFLKQHGLASLFPVAACMEDGPGKPDPTPVRVALERLGVRRAWMIGDNPDDVRAARSAGVLPIGVRAPGDDDVLVPSLLRAGAARVLEHLDQLEALLP
jgi:histidinol-phosphate aminotransferase